MGIYLNPGKQSFQMAVNSEIYVDKTDMIHYLNSIVNTQQRFASVSRPRRFGKTMAADMICAYYDREAESRELFENRKLSKTPEWDQYLGKFDVIRIVMTDYLQDSENADDMLRYLTEEITGELRKAYPDIDYIRRT